LDLIIEAEEQARLVVNGLSVLRQMGRRLDLHADVGLEFVRILGGNEMSTLVQKRVTVGITMRPYDCVA